MAAEALLAGAALLLGLYALLFHNVAAAARCRNAVGLRGKTVLVTGGNSGIGKATALDLARRGARVVLACRSRARGESAVCDIRRESGNNEVVLMILNLASLNSVRAFAETFLRCEPRLDILINNAGVFGNGQTDNGFDQTFQINHLAHFLLTHLLLDRLKRCAPSRIIVVASSAHWLGNIDFRSIHRPVEGKWQAIKAYCHSKLANILHVRELASRLEGSSVTCYVTHPGVVNTDIARSAPWWLKKLSWFIKPLLRDCNDGAQTIIYCATEEGIERFSGRYFVDCRPQVPWKPARNDRMAKQLWETSERLLGLAA